MAPAAVKRPMPATPPLVTSWPLFAPVMCTLTWCDDVATTPASSGPPRRPLLHGHCEGVLSSSRRWVEADDTAATASPVNATSTISVSVVLPISSLLIRFCGRTGHADIGLIEALVARLHLGAVPEIKRIAGRTLSSVGRARRVGARFEIEMLVRAETVRRCSGKSDAWRAGLKRVAQRR